MNGEALGVIEVVGMAAAIEAADSCVKSANVELIGYELTKGSGLVTIKIRGNVGAVKAALEAAKVSVARISNVYASLIIPRPAANLEKFIQSDISIGIKSDKSETEDLIQGDIEDKIKGNSEEAIVEKDIKDIKDIKEEKFGDIIENKIEEKESQDVVDSEIKEEKSEDVAENKMKENISGDTEKYVHEEIKQTEESFDDKKNFYIVALNKNQQEDKIKIEEDYEEKFSEDDISLSEEETEEESEDICNVCRDSKCPRRKGQPRNLCIHYKRT